MIHAYGFLSIYTVLTALIYIVITWFIFCKFCEKPPAIPSEGLKEQNRRLTTGVHARGYLRAPLHGAHMQHRQAHGLLDPPSLDVLAPRQIAFAGTIAHMGFVEDALTRYSWVGAVFRMRQVHVSLSRGLVSNPLH